MLIIFSVMCWVKTSAKSHISDPALYLLCRGKEEKEKRSGTLIQNPG